MMDGLDWALAMSYVWLKAGHIIFVIFWVAGLFMLPRFYVYHQEAPVGSDEEKRWIERERKLRGIILTPAMIMVWVLGLSLAYITGAWTQGWFQGKLVLVIALRLSWLDGRLRQAARGGRAAHRGAHAADDDEIPGIAVIFIVTLVVVGRALG